MLPSADASQRWWRSATTRRLIVLMDAATATALIDGARSGRAGGSAAKGFSPRIETVNTMEAWLGRLPGHVVPECPPPADPHRQSRRPAAAGRASGQDARKTPARSIPPARLPCCMPPQPARHHSGSTCMSSDVGHTLIFGPTGAGKSTLLCTIALQALRYRRGHDHRLRQGPLHVGHGAAPAADGTTTWAATGAGRRFAPRRCWKPKRTWPGPKTGSRPASNCRPERPPTPREREAIHRARAAAALGNDRTLTHFVAQVQDETVREALRLLHAGRHPRPAARCRAGRPHGTPVSGFRDRGPDGDGRAEFDPGPALLCSAGSSDR